MKYVHWIVYPALIAVILVLTYATVDRAVWLDDMKQDSRSKLETTDALLRFIAVDSPCAKTPQQLASAMGGLDYIVDESGVFFGAFQAKYEGNHLVSVEDVGHRKVTVCRNGAHL